jgi:hypothetical protein
MEGYMFSIAELIFICTLFFFSIGLMIADVITSCKRGKQSKSEILGDMYLNHEFSECKWYISNQEFENKKKTEYKKNL